MRSSRNRICCFVLILVCMFSGCGQVESSQKNSSANEELRQAFLNKRSDFFIEAKGFVTRILSDDLEGSRHQRFIIMLATRQTLLISHNIDIAPRVEGLKMGDRVQVFGEYEYNDKGGVIHWTHHDPSGRRAGGWIRHGGEIYQ